MPLSQEAQLLSDVALQQRVTMALLHISTDVLNEAPDTPDHDNRIKLAGAAMRDPNTYGKAMYNYVIIQPGIVENGGNSSVIADQTLLDAVSAMWDVFSDQLFGPPVLPTVR